MEPSLDVVDRGEKERTFVAVGSNAPTIKKFATAVPLPRQYSIA